MEHQQADIHEKAAETVNQVLGSLVETAREDPENRSAFALEVLRLADIELAPDSHGDAGSMWSRLPRGDKLAAIIGVMGAYAKDTDSDEVEYEYHTLH